MRHIDLLRGVQTLARRALPVPTRPGGCICPGLP